MNGSVSSNTFWLKNSNHLKFTEEFVICTKKHVFVKYVYKLAKNGFPTLSLHRKDSLLTLPERKRAEFSGQ